MGFRWVAKAAERGFRWVAKADRVYKANHPTRVIIHTPTMKAKVWTSKHHIHICTQSLSKPLFSNLKLSIESDGSS